MFLKNSFIFLTTIKILRLFDDNFVAKAKLSKQMTAKQIKIVVNSKCYTPYILYY
jgi:hypothetical protein